LLFAPSAELLFLAAVAGIAKRDSVLLKMKPPPNMKIPLPIEWKLLVSSIEFSDLEYTQTNFNSAVSLYLNVVAGRPDGREIEQLTKNELIALKDWLAHALLIIDGPVKRKVYDCVNAAIAELVVAYQNDMILPKK